MIGDPPVKPEVKTTDNEAFEAVIELIVGAKGAENMRMGRTPKP